MILALAFLGLTSRTPILTFHDIIAVRTKDSKWFDCTVKEFEDQIAWFKKRHAVFVSTAMVYKSLSSKKALPKNAVCMTFADNYLGFYRYAWPILKRERIPVTQFVHTGFVGSKVGRPKLTWAQLIELDRTGLVTIGSQTVTHPEDLTLMSSAQVLAEFRNSKQHLEAKLGHQVFELAYPNGKFDTRVSAIAKEAGYSAAYTEGCIPAEKATNFFEIPRYVHTRYRDAWQIAHGRS